MFWKLIVSHFPLVCSLFLYLWDMGENLLSLELQTIWRKECKMNFFSLRASWKCLVIWMISCILSRTWILNMYSWMEIGTLYHSWRWVGWKSTHSLRRTSKNLILIETTWWIGMGSWTWALIDRMIYIHFIFLIIFIRFKSFLPPFICEEHGFGTLDIMDFLQAKH